MEVRDQKGFRVISPMDSILNLIFILKGGLMPACIISRGLIWRDTSAFLSGSFAKIPTKDGIEKIMAFIDVDLILFFFISGLIFLAFTPFTKDFFGSCPVGIFCDFDGNFNQAETRWSYPAVDGLGMGHGLCKNKNQGDEGKITKGSVHLVTHEKDMGQIYPLSRTLVNDPTSAPRSSAVRGSG